MFRFDAAGLPTRYNDGAITQEAAPIVAVTDGATITGIDTTLAASSTITGRVADADLLSGIYVLGCEPVSGRCVTHTTTAVDGTFTLSGIDDISYAVVFFDPVEAVITVFGSSSTDPATGTPVTPVDGAWLNDAWLVRCSFVGADFTGASLAGADLTGADLTGANLTEADLGGAILTGATLTGARTYPVVGRPAALPTGWYRVDVPSIEDVGYLIGPGADLTGALLNGGSFDGLNLSGINFTDASIHFTSFRGADLTGVDFTDADLQGSPLGDGPIGKVDFSDADLTGANFTGADFSEVYFSGAIVTGVDLTDAGFRDVTLHRVRSEGGIIGTPGLLPPGWSIAGGHLVGPGVDLSGVDLIGVDLTNTKLAGADLTGATITDAVLGGTDLGSATTGDAVTSADLVGVPANLPPGWSLVDGRLVEA